MGNNVSAPLGEDPVTDSVIVPDVVGLPFLEASEIASAAGVSVANPDADGPQISAIVWPNNPTVQSQHPAPGTVTYRWDSLAVWLRSDFEPDMARKLDTPPPSTDRAHAMPEAPIQVTDVANEESPERTSPSQLR